MEINALLITQARKGSTRLPGKVLKKINGKELLTIHLERLQEAKLVNKIIVATTIEKGDDEIFDLMRSKNIPVYRGSENDVLDRFYQSVKHLELNPKWIVRVTSDCPLLDPRLVDAVIEFAEKNNLDYAANVLKGSFPDGQDVEVFKYDALKIAWNQASKCSDREHVTPFIRNNSDYNGGTLFKAKDFTCAIDYSKIRMTVDEESDFILIQKLIADLGTNESWLTYAKYIIDNNLFEINGDIIRNEGYLNSLKND